MPRAVVVILTAGAVLAVACTLVATAFAPRPAVGPGATVAVIGDSYSAGTALGGLGAANWTARLARDRGWRMHDLAIPGTGYLASRPGAPDYAAAQLDPAVALEPDLVVVQGSLNDGGLPPERVGAAAAELYAAIHVRAPLARLVVIGPAWPGDTPPATTLAVRDAVGEAARAAGAAWIDPMSEQWFADPAARATIGADGLHPTDAGHRLMADRTADALSALGLR
ncbi:SGNH/GDSL hydrolase family protein [Actinomycetospora chiangmaiensis]|uniref:SGNH/GDSL hydrolase family protein n=1 Tax=Actinomycetospora chiangmaiensis TaxID=402650 RepID=UPI00037E73BB|nr:SGNH/GDSL hydrolase family protein [Actinomycetospora chiangmaiensis]